MGAGKSSVGRIVAARVGVPFVDVDDEIVAGTGRTVGDLWRAGGASAFRPLERAVVLETLARPTPVVLAVPAGAIEDPACVAALSGPSVTVVYLRAPAAVLAARIGADSLRRPFLGTDPIAVLTEQYARRDARYEALADRVVAVDRIDPETAADDLVALGALAPARASDRRRSGHRRAEERTDDDDIAGRPEPG